MVALPIASAQKQEPEIETGFRVYIDDDHVTVMTPSAAASVDPIDSLQISIATSIDAVSAASVDVITSASPKRIEETRVEAATGLTWSPSPVKRLRVHGVFSHENDYDSLRLGFGGQVEVAERNATIDLAYTAAFDAITDVTAPEFQESRRGHFVAGSFTQILDPRTYVDAFVDLRYLSGYHASPYRKVLLREMAGPVIVKLAETTPERRTSAAARLRVRRVLGAQSDWFLHGSYRFYRDSWKVQSHTIDAQLLHSMLNERLLLRAQLRGYSQSAAEFYQPYYYTSDGESPTFRTQDRILGGMRSVHLGVTMDATIPRTQDWRLRGMLSGTQFMFDNFPAQQQRRALTLGVSLNVPM